MKTYERTERELDALSRNIVPLVKSGFLGRLGPVRTQSIDSDFRFQKPLKTVKDLRKIRTAKIKVPALGVNGTRYVLTERMVLGQLSNLELAGASAYSVYVHYPSEIYFNAPKEFDATVKLYANKEVAKEIKSRERAIKQSQVQSTKSTNEKTK